MVIAETIAIWPLIFCAIVVFALVLILSARFADRLLLADTPNDRSSHQVRTSRAGGVAIIGAWFIGLFLALIAGVFTVTQIGAAISFILLTGMACLFGVLDDGFNLRPAVKFIGQFLPAVLLVSIFGAVQSAPLPFVGETNLGLLAFPLSVFWIVGMMNAYNFMDGINGLAACCAALVLFVIAIIAIGAGQAFIGVSSLLLATALAGFLPGNLSRGNIFMGDGGSQAIGFAIGAFGILLPTAPNSSFVVPVFLVPIMMIPFIADVAFTLVHRLRRRQNVLHAHREHSYQFLFRAGLTHSEVSSIYLAMVAVCSAVAVAFLSMSTLWHPWAALGLVMGFMIFANRVFAMAKARALLSGMAMQPDMDSQADTAMEIQEGAAEIDRLGDLENDHGSIEVAQPSLSLTQGIKAEPEQAAPAHPQGIHQPAE